MAGGRLTLLGRPLGLLARNVWDCIPGRISKAIGACKCCGFRALTEPSIGESLILRWLITPTRSAIPKGLGPMAGVPQAIGWTAPRWLGGIVWVTGGRSVPTIVASGACAAPAAEDARASPSRRNRHSACDLTRPEVRRLVNRSRGGGRCPVKAALQAWATSWAKGRGGGRQLWPPVCTHWMAWRRSSVEPARCSLAMMCAR